MPPKGQVSLSHLNFNRLFPDHSRWDPMQILITGWTGYIAPVMARVLRLAGHQLTGLDTGFFEPCSMGSVADPGFTHSEGRPRCFAGRSERLRCGHPPGGSLERPDGGSPAGWTYRINLDGSLHLARMAREAGVRSFLFSSSCSIYGASNRRVSDRNLASPASFGLRDFQSQDRRGTGKTGNPIFFTGLHAQCHGLWNLPTNASRSRFEQPHRLGVHYGTSSNHERRHTVETNRPH